MSSVGVAVDDCVDEDSNWIAADSVPHVRNRIERVFADRVRVALSRAASHEPGSRPTGSLDKLVEDASDADPELTSAFGLDMALRWDA